MPEEVGIVNILKSGIIIYVTQTTFDGAGSAGLRPIGAIAVPVWRPETESERRAWTVADLKVWTCVWIALGITFLQLAFVLVLAKGGNSFLERYRSLAVWDSGWYENIVENGYRSTIPPVTKDLLSNVAFFPGYPVLARAIREVLGIETRIALLVTAQLASWVLWTYMLLFLRRWRASGVLAMNVMLLILFFPSAFYLVAGYSESLFIASMLGFLYWSTDARKYAWLLAAAHGFVMSATRLVGLPLVVIPVILTLLGASATSARSFKPWAIAGLASLGGLSFFLYSRLRFGHWDLYAQTSKAGWGTTPMYSAIFEPSLYQIRFSSVMQEVFDPSRLSRMSWLFALITTGILLTVDSGWSRKYRDRSWFFRIVLYGAALLTLYISVAGVYTLGLQGMIRYALPAAVLLVLAAAHFLTRPYVRSRFPAYVAEWVMPILIMFMSAIEISFVQLFTEGKWVA